MQPKHEVIGDKKFDKDLEYSTVHLLHFVFFSHLPPSTVNESMSFFIFLMTDALISDEPVAKISVLVCTKASLWTKEYSGTIVSMIMQLLGEICSLFLGAFWGKLAQSCMYPVFSCYPLYQGIPPS